MLDLFRKKQKSVFIKAAFAVIILSFVIGYAMMTSPGERGGQSGTYAVRVNDTEISYDEYQTVYGNIYSLYQNVYRDQFTPAMEKQLGLRSQAINSLVDQALLVQEADRMKIRVSQQELVDSIAAIPSFQENGVFNKARYLQVLAYQRLTPEDFEASQKNQLLAAQVRDTLQKNISVTEAEVAEEFRNQNEKVNLSFVRLAPGLFESQVKVNEEDLKAYFDQNKENFRIPESVALRYLLFEPSRYENEVTHTDEDLDKYYRRHLDNFEIEEKAKAAHILIKVGQDADQATRNLKRQLAEKVLELAKTGKDFGELVHQYSDDQGTIAQDGDLGFFTRGTMVPEFERAAFALKPGELSELVESPFGYHIIKSEQYIEAGIQPKTEVLDQVKAGVTAEKSRQLALEKAMDAYNINRKNGDIDAAAKANDLGIKETNFFERSAPIDSLGDVPQIGGAAFSLEPGKIARPVTLEKNVILYAVKERRESRLPELAEVRSEVEQAYRSKYTLELAQRTADEMLTALKGGKTLSSLAKTQNLTVEETGLFTRSYGNFIPRLGDIGELAQAAFTLTTDSPASDKVHEIDGKFVIAELKEHQTPDPASIDAAQQETLRATVLSRKQDQMIDDKLKELREKAKIVIAPNILASIEKG